MKRIFTLAILSLVVLSPILGAMQPVQTAAAQETECDNAGQLLHIISGGHAGCDAVSQEIEDHQETKAIEDEQTLTDVKALAATQREQQEAHIDVRQNYLIDSEDAALSKAQAAITESLPATANNTENVTQAQVRENATAAVADYYARQQYNVLEAWNGTMASAQYLNTLVTNESGLTDDMVTMPGNEDWHGDLDVASTTFVNGTSKNAYKWVTPNASGTITSGNVSSLDLLFFGAEDQTTRWIPQGTEVISLTSAPTFEGDYAVSLDSDSDSYSDYHYDFAADGVSDPQKISYWVNWQNSLSTAGYTLADSGDSRATDFETHDSPETNQWFKVVWKNLDNGTYDFELYKLDSDGVGTTLVQSHSGTHSGDLAKAYIYDDDTSAGHAVEVIVDNLEIEGEGTPKDTIFVNDPEGENEIITELKQYRDVWTDIENRSQRLEDNAAQIANQTYDEYVAGNVSKENLISNWDLTSQYATDFNSTGYYSYAVNSLASAGLGTGDLDNASTFTVRTVENGTNVTYEGQLMSSSSPTYPNGSEKVNGTWYAGYVYNTTDIAGNQFVITLNSTYEILDGEFEITEMLDRDGNSVNQVDHQEQDYQYTDTSDWVNRSQELQDLREQLEALEPEVGSGGTSDSSGWSWPDLPTLPTLTPSVGGAVIIGLLAAVFLLFRG